MRDSSLNDFYIITGVDVWTRKIPKLLSKTLQFITILTDFRPLRLSQ